MVRGEKESTVPLPHAVNCPSPDQVFQLTMALTLKRYERRSLPQALKLFLSYARTYIVNDSCIKIMQKKCDLPAPGNLLPWLEKAVAPLTGPFAKGMPPTPTHTHAWTRWRDVELRGKKSCATT